MYVKITALIVAGAIALGSIYLGAGNAGVPVAALIIGAVFGNTLPKK